MGPAADGIMDYGIVKAAIPTLLAVLLGTNPLWGQ